MTNETQHTSDQKQSTSFGARLKSAREAMGLERKDVADQLRLNEKVIIMMEKDRYPADLPVTFIRGYLRSYGKLLQIPEYEIKKALEPIKPKVQAQNPAAIVTTTPPVTSGNYFMQMFTYLIVFTLIGLVGTWWYSHNTIPTQAIAENQISLPEQAAAAPQQLATNNAVTQPVHPVTPPLTDKQPSATPSTTPNTNVANAASTTNSPAITHDDEAPKQVAQHSTPKHRIIPDDDEDSDNDNNETNSDEAD